MFLGELHFNEFWTRFLAAIVLGSLIGFERQVRQRAAGIHTITLIAAGAAIFTMIAPLLGISDQNRTVAQIITGVGFLAGAVIFKEKATVRGLNTAATMWATSAVGALAGYGLFGFAALAAIGITGVNLVYQPFVDFIESRRTKEIDTRYHLDITCNPEAEHRVRDILVDVMDRSSLRLKTIASKNVTGGAVDVDVDLSKDGRDDRSIAQLVQTLKGEPGVLGADYQTTEVFG
jgi:putative Mg2+ transporter-C (MgtC) family protein